MRTKDIEISQFKFKFDPQSYKNLPWEPFRPTKKIKTDLCFEEQNYKNLPWAPF